MRIDWSALLGQLGATATLIAALAWIARSFGTQWLSRDLETHKVALKRDADAQIEEFKSTLQEKLERTRVNIASEGERAKRVRAEKERWANPIQLATRGLTKRLHNILEREAWNSLDPDYQPDPQEWAIDHDYFLTSTAFLFAQFFCVESLLRRTVRQDLFLDEESQDAFFKLLLKADCCLRAWPWDKDNGDADQPVFALQQRAIGEACTVGAAGQEECLTYNAFLEHWENPTFRKRTAPLEAFLLRLSPQTPTRWDRTKELRKALEEIDQASAGLLKRGAA